MAQEITGTVTHVSEIETFGAKQTQKRFVVIEVEDGQYKNLHGFQVFNDKCGMLDACKVGEEVTISYNLGTVREYNGKWYADMHRAWKVVAEGGQSAPVADNPPVDDDEDDVPF